jgi:hypothetical protein
MSSLTQTATAVSLRLREITQRRHYSEFCELFVESKTRAGELVIRDNLPAIDAMRAGVLLGLKFTVKELEGVKRLTASKAA